MQPSSPTVARGMMSAAPAGIKSLRRAGRMVSVTAPDGECLRYQLGLGSPLEKRRSRATDDQGYRANQIRAGLDEVVIDLDQRRDF